MPALLSRGGRGRDLREQLERRDVPWLDRAEVATVERCDSGLSFPLRQRDHRGVDEPEVKTPFSILRSTSSKARWLLVSSVRK
jgi:hypothetical protein